MAFKQQPLNQNEYSMKIIKDLGMQPSPSNPSRFYRKAIVECSICHTHFEMRMGSTKAKQQTNCIKCMSTHNLSDHALYPIWNGIRQRCYNPKRKDYPRYGGIGVTMCDAWKDNVEAFIDWCISNGWSSDKVIDKDIKSAQLGISHAIYSPETVSFITVQQNAEIANGKLVEQYDLNGNLLNIYESCTKAALALGKPKAAKSSIANCCRGLTLTSFGFKWKFSQKGPIESQGSLQTTHMLETLEDIDTTCNNSILCDNQQAGI